jgi:hypothetical protein
MLDFHLASLYQVETRALKHQVKRNADRFPDDFMFHLSKEELLEVITNCDNLGARETILIILMNKISLYVGIK